MRVAAAAANGRERTAGAAVPSPRPGREVFVTATTTTTAARLPAEQCAASSRRARAAAENNFEETHLKSDLNIAHRSRS